MGREALITAVCCLMISGTRAVNNLALKDQLGAESGSRLYRQAPGLVYASAVPYGAYSFQLPTISAPQAASSRIVPVKEALNLQHGYGNGNLKDSYGNRFVEALQSMKSLPFKPFPQQYVQLQELPAHFAQPLAAAGPVSYQQYRQPTQAVAASHYRLPLQAAAPNHHQQISFAHPGVYADSIKHLSPASIAYGPHFGSVVHHVPVQSVAPTRESHKSSAPNQDSSRSLSEHKEHRVSEHSSGHRAVQVEPQSQEHYHHLPGEHKFQRLQEAPLDTFSEEEAPARPVKHKVTTQQLVSAVQETPIATVVNGKKTVVNVKTKPPLPLLDINLLEPLTFANPLVPQVQHFLPRINEATYHKLPELDNHEDKKYQKEFVTQKTKSYDSGVIKGKPKKPKNKQKPKVEHHNYNDYIPAATARPQVTVTKALDNAPEIVYEINAPNYKETIKEKAVTYNKQTNSEPVHYSYGSKSQKAPVQYSYTHTSKEPVHIQEVHYEGKGEGPKHLIYNLKPEENNRESEKSKTESEDSGESSEHSEDDSPPRHHHREHKDHHPTHNNGPKENHHYVPEHREQEYHHKPSSDSHRNVHHSDHHHKPNSNTHYNEHHDDRHSPSSDGHHNDHYSERAHHKKHSSGHERHHNPSSDSHQHVKHSNNPVEYESVDVTPFQYEEDISLTAPIKVDPNQHVQHGHAESPQKSPSPHGSHHNSRSSDSPQHYAQSEKSKPRHDHDTPPTHVQEKTKQVYIKEETPEEDDTVGEQLMKAMFGKEEDKEQDFENAYKNAAFGFPAYEKTHADIEKDIYNPESYGAPREHSAYDIDHAPFQQYHEHGDSYPKEVRLSYKDDRDKMKEDYFLDYSVSKPESLADRYQNKANYYKLYKDQRPEKYVAHEDDKNKKSAKLTAIPYSYYPVFGDNNMKQLFAQYKAAPYVLEYDYSKGLPAKPKDNSAHASRPLQQYKMTTHFVEPQFQFGFEPIALPRLLDSELAAMASNNSPESEKPGTRKKIYKENFYIKKTRMLEPNS